MWYTFSLHKYENIVLTGFSTDFHKIVFKFKIRL